MGNCGYQPDIGVSPQFIPLGANESEAGGCETALIATGVLGRSARFLARAGTNRNLPVGVRLPYRHGILAASGTDLAEEVSLPGEPPNDPDKGADAGLRGNFAPRPESAEGLRPAQTIEPPLDAAPSENDYPGRKEALTTQRGEGGTSRALELIEDALAMDDLTPLQRLCALIDKGICLRRAHLLRESTNTLKAAARLEHERELQRAKPHREFAIALLLEAKKVRDARAREYLLLEALNEIDKAVKLEPESPSNHSVKAEIFLLHHRFTRALGEIREAIRLGENLAGSSGHQVDPRLYYILADILWEMTGQTQPALDAIDKALEIRPDSIKHRMCKAKILAKHSALDGAGAEEHLSTALGILEEIEREQPSNRLNYELMSDVLLRLARLREDDVEGRAGFYGKALATVEKLKNLASNNLNVKIDEAEALAGLGRDGEALEIALEVSRDRRRIPKALCRLAEIMSKIGEHRLAVEFAEEAIKAEPSDPRNYVKLVEIYEITAQLNYAEAAARYGIRHFEERGQNRKILHLAIALIRVRLKMGRNDDALRAVKMALSIRIPPYLLAKTYHMTGIDLPPILSERIGAFRQE